MSGTILRRRDRTARPPRVEHYSSAVNNTLGAIAGPIREALHGTPTDLIATAKQRHLGQAPDIIEAMEGLYGKISRSGHQV